MPRGPVRESYSPVLPDTTRPAGGRDGPAAAAAVDRAGAIGVRAAGDAIPGPVALPVGDVEGGPSPLHAGQREHVVLDGPGDVAAGVQDGVGGCGVGQG